jgi:P-type Ca2+ transporter type 2C
LKLNKNLAAKINPAALQNKNSRDAFLLSPYAYPSEKITSLLDVKAEQGLSKDEAAKRLLRDGANSIETKQGRRWRQIFLSQFASIVIWLLAFAAIVAWFTESRLESVAIFVVLIINAIIGFAIEMQAGNALNALRKSTHINVRVRRGSSEQVIDATEIVSGDIILLSAGDRIPADSLLIEAFNLQVEDPH